MRHAASPPNEVTDTQRIILLSIAADRMEVLEESLRDITVFKITDSNNDEVYEDSVHEMRKIARRALEGK